MKIREICNYITNRDRPERTVGNVSSALDTQNNKKTLTNYVIRI